MGHQSAECFKLKRVQNVAEGKPSRKTAKAKHETGKMATVLGAVQSNNSMVTKVLTGGGGRKRRNDNEKKAQKWSAELAERNKAA